MLEKIFEEGLLNYQDLLMRYYLKLNINSDEVVVLLQLLSLAQKKRYNLSTTTLARMTSLKMYEVGEIVNSLFEKNLIDIRFERKSNEKYSEVFSLEPFFQQIAKIFAEEMFKQKESQNITEIEYVIKTIENLFVKPLTPNNLEIIRQWFTDGYKKEEIDQAIDTTKKNGRKTVNYIDRILRSETYDQESTIDEKTADYLRKLVGK